MDHSLCRIKLVILAILVIIVIIVLPSTSFSVRAGPTQQTTYDDRLEAFMTAQMKRYHIPGAAIAIVRNAEVEYLGGFGIANARGEPVTADTPFLLASVSKSFTALALMQLVEAGKIDIDMPVRQYLPWFEVAGGRGKEITIAQLLYHTSGLSTIDGRRALLVPDSPDGLQTGVRALASLKLKSDPGDVYEYSNLNYSILGAVIQEVSGQSYDTYIQEHIFAPLGMSHSYTSLFEARQGGAASGYYPFFGIPIVYDRYMPYSRSTLPAGGLWSSAADMSHYLIAQLNDGRYGDSLLLSAEGITQLHTIGFEWGPGYGYAMGWTRNYGFLDPEFLDTLDTELSNFGSIPIVYHSGAWVNYSAMAFLLPEQDFGVVILMNSHNPSVESAFNGFAWDATLIAFGGEAQYFPPWQESFVVRNNRWIFSAVLLILIGELVWSIRTWRRIRQREDVSEPMMRTMLLHAGIPLLVDVILVAYLFLKLMPDNDVDLLFLIRNMPDLGLLIVLNLLLLIGWGAVRSALFTIAWAQKRRYGN